MNSRHLAAIRRREENRETVGGHDPTDDTRLMGKAGIGLRQMAMAGFNRESAVDL
jgi:hypothetical protein